MSKPSILIVTDTSPPQINGVVRTYEFLEQELIKKDFNVIYLDNSYFKTFPLPHYPEIRVAWNLWKIGAFIRQHQPDFIHIATCEGPIGFVTARYCHRHHIPFTAAYHTRFPEFVNAWFPSISVQRMHSWVKRIYQHAKTIFVPTPSMMAHLIQLGYSAQQLHLWGRGVDSKMFDHSLRQPQHSHQTIRLVCVSRVTEEKNLEDFFNLQFNDNQRGFELIMIGDGPSLEKYKKAYPHVRFLGYKTGQDLATELANADVFVFPSRLDTFGLVILEANACGTPVAAYPVTGPKDIIKNNINGFLHDRLDIAVMKCIHHVDRQRCAQYCLEHFSWATSCEQFIAGLTA